MIPWRLFITAYSGGKGKPMKQLKLITGILLIFFTGMAAGHLGTVAYFKNKIYKEGPPALHHMLRHKITQNLQLTEAQQIKFERIIGQAEKDFDAFRQNHHAEVEQIFTDCFQKINGILDPKQQKQLEKIKKRFRFGFDGPESCSPSRHFKDRPMPPPDAE